MRTSEFMNFKISELKKKKKKTLEVILLRALNESSALKHFLILWEFVFIYVWFVHNVFLTFFYSMFLYGLI